MMSRKAFSERCMEFIPNNTLTVRCRMWRSGYTIPSTDFCYARTKLKICRGSFVWEVKEFSLLNSSATDDFRQLTSNEKRIYPLRPVTKKGPFMSLILYLKRNFESDDIYVNFLIEKGRDYVFNCELSLLAANGDVVVSQVERGRPYFSWTILRFWPLISKNKLIANKNLFLPNDTLFLKCSFEVCIGIISSEIEYCTPNVSPIAEKEKEVTTVEVDDSLIFEEYFSKDADENDFEALSKEKIDSDSCYTSCPLKAALGFLHSEATLSDVHLRFGTKLYAVHKNILCSRSPVFKTIFSKHIEENIIDINGMEENTLYLLLQYIYTDTIGYLQLQNVLDLFKAAADYQLMDLKNKCSNVLIVNLSKSNVHDILSLAIKYGDEKLEKAAHNFTEM